MLVLRMAIIMVFVLAVDSTASAQVYAKVVCRYPGGGGSVGGVRRERSFATKSQCWQAVNIAKRRNRDSRYCTYDCVGTEIKKRSGGETYRGGGSSRESKSTYTPEKHKTWGKFKLKEGTKWVSNEDYREAVDDARKMAKAVDDDYLAKHLPLPETIYQRRPSSLIAWASTLLCHSKRFLELTDSGRYKEAELELGSAQVVAEGAYTATGSGECARETAEDITEERRDWEEAAAGYQPADMPETLMQFRGSPLDSSDPSVPILDKDGVPRILSAEEFKKPVKIPPVPEFTEKHFERLEQIQEYWEKHPIMARVKFKGREIKKRLEYYRCSKCAKVIATAYILFWPVRVGWDIATGKGEKAFVEASENISGLPVGAVLEIAKGNMDKGLNMMAKDYALKKILDGFLKHARVFTKLWGIDGWTATAFELADVGSHMEPVTTMFKLFGMVNHETSGY